MTATHASIRRNVLWLVQFLFIAAAAALGYSYVASAREGQLRTSCTSVCAMAPDYAGDDRVAPDFALATLDGPTFRLANQKGKAVLLVFWNTSCDACKQQLPGLRRLAELSRDDPHLAILAVAVDESAAQVAATLERHTGVKNPFPVALDPDSKIVQGRFGTKLFPETWVIDPSGTIRMRFDGPRDWAGSIARDLLRNVASNSACPLTLEARVARGPGAIICNEGVQ